MNCQEFTKRVDELVGGQLSLAAPHANLVGHAATCTGCSARLEAERALTIRLQALTSDERSIEAPAYLRNDLLVTFENRVQDAPSTVVSFPRRSTWARWALAAAATILIGFVMFAARWIQMPSGNETAGNVPPVLTPKQNDVPPSVVSVTPPQQIVEPSLLPDAGQESKLSRRQVSSLASRSRNERRTKRGLSTARSENVATEVASTEIKSAFVPLTYLNNATAMDSGIVVRVEVAREKLASLGLPFDLERADEIIKADIVLGDDGVARAIRLVQ